MGDPLLHNMTLVFKYRHKTQGALVVMVFPLVHHVRKRRRHDKDKEEDQKETENNTHLHRPPLKMLMDFNF